MPDRPWRMLTVIALGGVIGAELRYGVGTWLATAPGRFPWATLLVNVVGGFGIGVLMAWLGRVAHPHPLIRPFFGVGILGGLTTFSTFSTDTYRLLDAGRIWLALAYAVLTLVAALGATIAGAAAVRAAVVGAAAGGAAAGGAAAGGASK